MLFNSLAVHLIHTFTILVKLSINEILLLNFSIELLLICLTEVQCCRVVTRFGI